MKEGRNEEGCRNIDIIHRAILTSDEILEAVDICLHESSTQFLAVPEEAYDSVRSMNSFFKFQQLNLTKQQ